MTSFFYIVYNIRYIIRRIYHTRYGMVSLSDLTKNNNRDPLWLKLKRRLQRIIAAYRSITFGQWSICNFYPLLRFIYRKSAIETQNNKIIEKHSMILSKCDRKLLTCIKVEFQNGVMWKNVNSAHDYPMSIHNLT